MREPEKMKLRAGKSVEVLRKENDLCKSWFSAKIMAVDGNDFIVRYKSLMDRKGELVVERVCRRDIRPRPPISSQVEGWIVGDLVEVFDMNCWKVGKVTKVMRNNRFVIRILGSIQHKEFDECKMRIRQAWHQNKWSGITKVRMKHQSGLPSLKWNDIKTQLEARCGEPFSTEKRISCKRMKSNINVGAYDRPVDPGVDNHSLFMQVDQASTNNSSDRYSKLGRPTSYVVHKSSESAECTEDSCQCSVASCSLNESFNPENEFSKQLGERISGSDGSNAESSFPSMPGKDLLSAPLLASDVIDVNIHKLEFQAYKLTMQVLYTSGPLSWEQESLLTNLRLSLHITNEEHLLHLRHLLSSQVL